VIDAALLAGGLSRVVTRDGLQDQRRVAHRSSHRSDVIERPGERHDAARTGSAVRGFEADNPAKGGGFTNRTAGIRAERGIAQAGGDCCRRTAGGAARNPVGCVRVDDRAVKTRDRGCPEGKLMHVQFAEKHRSGFFELAHHGGVFGRNSVLEDRAACRRAHAGRVNQILERDGDAVQGAAPSAFLHFGLRNARLGERRVSRHCDECVELRIEPLDTGQACLRQVDGRQFPRPP